MLVHLRRSLVLAVICLVFSGSSTPFAVSACLSCCSAPSRRFTDGQRIDAHWPDWPYQVPGNPMGSCVLKVAR